MDRKRRTHIRRWPHRAVTVHVCSYLSGTSLEADEVDGKRGTRALRAVTPWRDDHVRGGQRLDVLHLGSGRHVLLRGRAGPRRLQAQLVQVVPEERPQVRPLHLISPVPDGRGLRLLTVLPDKPKNYEYTHT
jgi:hypothetical protein